jgi:hypothetical protein
VVVQSAIALVLAVLLAAAGRVAEAAGRALRPLPRRAEPGGLPLVEVVVGWPSRLLAAGQGSRAPPRSALAW